MKVRFFDPGKGYLQIRMKVLKEIDRVLTNGDLILRKDVELFEQELAKFVGTKYAVGLNSGTDALYIALKALGIRQGDKVLVPSHTFVATAQVVAQVGAEVVLYDLGHSRLRNTMLEGIKALMVTHIAGDFAITDMAELVEIAHRRGIHVIEDACQSIGATHQGKKAGSFGDAGAFSFYPAKILGAYGDAGALVTSNKSIYLQALELRNHYKTDYSRWGINSRLDNLQAAVLRIKLKMLPDTLRNRQAVAKMYLTSLPTAICPSDSEGRVWQDFIIFVPHQRDTLYEFLKKEGIETMKNEYPFPITKQEKATHYESSSLRIPCNENLTVKEVRYVIKKINEFFGN